MKYSNDGKTTEDWVYKKMLPDAKKYNLILERVENKVLPGQPDLYYYFKDRNRATQGWIELKVVKSRSEKIGLRDSQINWLKRYTFNPDHNGFLLVYMGIANLGEAYLIDCYTINDWGGQLNKMGDFINKKGYCKRIGKNIINDVFLKMIGYYGNTQDFSL